MWRRVDQDETLTQVFLIHLVGVLLNKNKTTQNTLAMLYRKFFRKKAQLSDLLSEFVIFLKLDFLWRKLKISISNFSYLSPNEFWRIFRMLLNSQPTIKWRWKKFCCNYFDAKTQFDWTTSKRKRGMGGKKINFFLPSSSPLSFFRPTIYPKGCYFLLWLCACVSY